MDQLAAKDVLELEVSDFGPIVNAKIDLRPLTVFVGPSNTGKSYLAILIYALHVYFTGRSTTSRFFLNYERLLNLGPSFVDRETLNALNEFLKQVTNGIGDIRSEKEAVLPIPIVKAICSMFEYRTINSTVKSKGALGSTVPAHSSGKGTGDVRGLYYGNLLQGIRHRLNTN